MKRPDSLRRLWNGLALGLLALALCGLFWTPHDPAAQDFRGDALAGPSLHHWLGVDGLGRDFASRLWRGAGHTVLLAGAATILTGCLASLLLLAERQASPAGARLIRAAIGLWVALPVIFLGLLLLVFLPPSPWVLVAAAGIGNLALAFRQMRVLWLGVREALYIKSSEVLGSRGWRLLRQAIWPNLRPDFLGLGRLLFAMSALELSGLAFLGLIGDPDFPELGSILKQNQAHLYQAPFLVILPGALLSFILLAVHLAREE